MLLNISKSISRLMIDTGKGPQSTPNQYSSIPFDFLLIG